MLSSTPPEPTNPIRATLRFFERVRTRARGKVTLRTVFRLYKWRFWLRNLSEEFSRMRWDIGRRPFRGVQALPDLPWQFTGERAAGPSDRITVLLTSHTARRTGAPLALLGLLKELVRRPEFECWVLLAEGGVLTAEFARYAPALALDTLAKRGGNRDAAIDCVANLVRQHATRVVALCNTVTTPEINSSLARHGVPVLSWVHELPTSIDAHYGGQETFDTLLATSHRIICPSEFVREALIASYHPPDPSRLLVRFYGHERPRPAPLREGARRRVRAELGLSDDAVIVLGCGTVDHRKGADLFAPIAAQVRSAASAADVWFVWVGEPTETSFLNSCRHDAAALGLTERVRFVGARPDPSDYFLAADIFALLSREDPFPIVNMEAMAAGLPVVAFRDSGGAAEVLDQDRGVLVPYLDVPRFAQAVADLALAPARRVEIGGRAERLLHAPPFTWAHFADQFRRLLTEDLCLFPARPLSVSVVVPCYNHERFIRRRIESILQQTRTPDEIIVLDDCSSDGTARIAAEYADRTAIPLRVIVNEVNGGNPFLQWQKGLAAASGDLVWIAEGDDSCEPVFLERLVPAFYDPAVVLAYSQSAPVDENDAAFEPNYHSYTNDISSTRWSRPSVVAGDEEIREALCLKNTIPNASAVVFRRSAGVPAAPDLAQYRFAGDWYFYAQLALGGKVAFVHWTLNYHRRTAETVTHKIESDVRAIEENLTVKTWIYEHATVPASQMARGVAYAVSEYYRLGERHDLERPSFMDNDALVPARERLRAAIESRLPLLAGARNILVVLGDAELGGGQIAGIRIANELAKRHRVFLCNARPEFADPAVCAMVSPRVILLEGVLTPTPWSGPLSDPAYRTDLGAETERRLQVVADLVRFHDIGLVMSHMWWADRFVYAINRNLRLPWFIQMHGCYETLLANPRSDPEFETLLPSMMRAASGVGYLTERNLLVFDRHPAARPVHLRRFFNGLDLEVAAAAQAGAAAVGGDDFVFCLCSRAIPEKGWEEAIQATLAINRLPALQRGGKSARLVLIGDSTYAQKLKRRFRGESAIEFRGQLAEPMTVIAACDVGLLPSRFIAESVPFVVIEYLACGKPVIATRIGAIPEMLAYGERQAGIVIPAGDKPGAVTPALRDAMQRYMIDTDLLREHRANAAVVFRSHFDISKLADDYLAFFAVAMPPAHTNLSDTSRRDERE